MPIPSSGPLSFSTLIQTGMQSTAGGPWRLMGDGNPATSGSLVRQGWIYGKLTLGNNSVSNWYNKSFMPQAGMRLFYWPRIPESYPGTGSSITNLRTGSTGTKGANCSYSSSDSGVFQITNNSTGYITFPHDSLYNASNGSFAIMAWVKPTTSNYFFIVHKGPSNGAPNNFPGNYEFRITPNYAVEVLFQPNTFSTTQFSYWYTENNVITPNTFVHLAVSTNGSTTSIYVNGVSKSLTFYGTTGTAVAVNTAPIYSGFRADDFYCVGTIAMVGIYPNRTLSQAEVTDAYNGTNYFI